MKRQARIIIIGLGSAGLSALDEVIKVTDDFLLIQDGPYGTSCARSACMPTKTLIEVAKAYHGRKIMAAGGVSGTEELRMNIAAALEYVRQLRDIFVNGMIEETNRYNSRIIQGKAVFLEPAVLQVGKTVIEGERIIIATGSRPVYPEAWRQFDDLLLTTEDMVEQPNFPPRMAVIGLGPAGLEYAQALSRLGVDITGFDALPTVAGISDPRINESVLEIMRGEFSMILGDKVKLTRQNGELIIQAGDRKKKVQKALLAIGRRPNIEGLGLKKIGIPLDNQGLPFFSRDTMQIEDAPIFIAGDANGDRPILHEAVDEGHIAGFNTAHGESRCFKRRVPLTITFTEPGIAAVGKARGELRDEDIVTGTYDFSKQSRARMSDANKGLLQIYVEKKTGCVLGAEMAAPAGEHLAHFLALAINRQMTVFDLLTTPFYHPAVEEGLRTAIRDAGEKTSTSPREADLLLCRSAPRAPL